MSQVAAAMTYVDAPNQLLSASNGVDDCYRQTGDGAGVPLLMFQHFRGNLVRRRGPGLPGA